MAVILSPFMMLIAALKFVEPASYPTGDARNDLVFRVTVYGGAFVVFAVVLVSSILWLRRNGSNTKTRAGDFGWYRQVRLVSDRFAAEGAPRGTIGTIVEVYDGAYEVEVSDRDGATIAMFVATDSDLEATDRAGDA